MTLEGMGHLAALGCAATWAVATLLFGKAAQTVDPRALNLWKCAVSTLLLGATALIVGDLPRFSARDVIALFASAVLVNDINYFCRVRQLFLPVLAMVNGLRGDRVPSQLFTWTDLGVHITDLAVHARPI